MLLSISRALFLFCVLLIGLVSFFSGNSIGQIFLKTIVSSFVLLVVWRVGLTIILQKYEKINNDANDNQNEFD